jgi:ABC-type transporter MlaC component
MSRSLVVAVLLGALALSPSFAAAQDEDASIEQLVVEMAHTKAEHQALAKFYAEKADEARKLASRHQGMARAYLGGKGMGKQPMTSHCKRIAEQQEAIAKEYDALAKLHEDEAKQAK